jgi:hypothetical protein
LDSYGEDIFLTGVAIPESDVELTFRSTKLENDGIPDDVLQAGVALPLFSERLRTILEQNAIRTIQHVPARVFDSQGRPFQGFSIANVLSVVPALDLEQSQFTVFPSDYFVSWKRGRIKSLNRTVLKAPAVAEFDIIRVSQYEFPLFVNDRFRLLFEAARCTGFSFAPVHCTD